MLLRYAVRNILIHVKFREFFINTTILTLNSYPSILSNSIIFYTLEPN